MKVFIFWSQSRLKKLKKWIVVNSTVMYWITKQKHGGDVTGTTFWNPVGIRIVYIMNYHKRIYTRRNVFNERV